MESFYSPKNQAKWKIELNGLKKEREIYQRTGEGRTTVQNQEKQTQKTSVHRERTTYNALVKEEQQERGIKEKSRTAPTKQMEKTRALDGPQK